MPRTLRMLAGLQAEGEAAVLVHWTLAEDVRTLARAVAQSYFDMRKALGFPQASEQLRRELLAAEETAG